MKQILHKVLSDLKNGKPIILLDQKREKEADLVIPAQYADEKNLIFLLKYTSGMVCISMLEERLNKLGLKPLIDNPTKKGSCSFYTSVDPKRENATGISARDKAEVIYSLIHDEVPVLDTRSSIAIPGHTFPLKARSGGVLERAGHTEGSLDLMILADLYPAAVISELMDRKYGKPTNLDDVKAFANEHNLAMLTIEELVEHRKKY